MKVVNDLNIVVSSSTGVISSAVDGDKTDAIIKLRDSLAQYVVDCFEEAKRFRKQDEDRFYEAMYARQGRYSPAKLAEIRQTGGSTEYARITANKSRILESWLRDIFSGQGEKPWTIAPTPVPDLSEEQVQQVKQRVSAQVASMFAQSAPVDIDVVRNVLDQELNLERNRIYEDAQLRAERMEKLMEDQLVEGGFYEAMADFITYLTTFPAAILKGPVVRQKETMSWDDVDGAYIPVLKKKITLDFDVVNPFNFYPAPGITSPQEGYVIEHITLTAKELADLIDVDGYDGDAIKRVLAKAKNGGYRWLGVTTYADAGGTEANDPSVVHSTLLTSYIDVLEFHGPVSGADLAKWLDEDESIDAYKYYEATVWVIDDEVIKVILNDDPLGRRPYYKTSYEPVPGQFWGNSLYDVLKDVQGVANAAIRSLVNNMAIASGPQVIVNIDRMPDGADVTNMFPWKIWQVIDNQFSNKVDRPIDFFQPSANVSDLLAVIERFYSFADDFSMIPRYMAGSDKMSGPGRTASGLSMLLDAANKGLKSIVHNIDQHVMTPLLRQLYDYNMRYSDDPSIKGDSQIVARGVASLMQLETLRLRRNEFLQITANPIDSQIVGVSGRAAILREIAKGLGIDVNKIVPPDALQGQNLFAQQDVQHQQQTTVGKGEMLANGAATTDVASPSAMVRG